MRWIPALDAGLSIDDLRDLLRHRDVGSTAVYLLRLERSPERVKVTV